VAAREREVGRGEALTELGVEVEEGDSSHRQVRRRGASHAGFSPCGLHGDLRATYAE
jgi:hypothetical protein